MERTKSLLTLENAVKFTVLALFMYNIITGIDTIKSDILLIKQGTAYEVQSLQYQIDECCRNKQNKKRLVFNQSQAILPNGINLEDE